MNEEVQIIYNIIYNQVSELGKVADTDKETIKNLAFNIYTVRECEEQLLQDGFVTEGLHGKKEHPAVSIKNKAEAQIRNAYILLGIDFSSKLKKKVSERDENDWEDFM